MPIFKVDQPIVLQEADGLWRDLRPNYEKIDIAKYLKFFIIQGEEKHGPQPYIMWDNGRKMRVRCEVILLDEHGRMLIKPNPGFKRLGEQYPYDCPGGGINKDESIEDAAARECKEEARIIPENIKFTGIHYTYEVPNDSKEHWGTWGHISFVCVAMKGDPYTGYVAPIDREESFIKKMTWVYPHEIDIIPAHEEAIRWYKQYYFNPIQEGVLPTLTFYHGSPVKYDQIKPTAFSAGNRFRDPSWSVFMFRQKELAQSFAFSRAAEKVCEERGIPHPRGWLEKDGFMHYKPIVVAPSDYYDKIKEAMFGVTVYVYTLEAPVDSNLNMIGTVGSLPEYVYSGTPKTVKVDEITMDGKLFEKWVTKISPEKFAEIKKTKPHRKNVVGPWIDLFVDMKRRKEMRDIVQQRLKDGTLKPGDNLDFLKEAAYLIGLSDSNVYALTGAQAMHVYGGYSDMLTEVAEFKPMDTTPKPNQVYDPQLGMWIDPKKKDKDKYLGWFEADEKTWLKKVKFISDPNVRGGKPQPVIYDNEGRTFRPRCEVIVLDGYKVLIDPVKNRGNFHPPYSLPGGGIDGKEDIATGARRECEEEARIIPKHCVYTGIAWMLEFADPTFNQGSVSFVCIAERGKEYKGYVKVEDRDPFADRAKWVDYRKFKLGEPHRIAIERFRDRQLKEEWIMDLDRSFLDAEYEAIDEDTGFIDQPVVFSGDDIYVNFDKFTSGEVKTCLITGLSGSGKSTLAKKIAEKMGAYYVATDVVSFGIIKKPENTNWDYIKENDKYLYKYFKRVGLKPEDMLNYPMEGNEKNVVVTPYIKWLCLERDDDGLVVCEGGDVAIALRDVPELSEMPIVFKGTSIFKAMFRRFLRMAGKKGYAFAIKCVLQKYSSQYGKMIPEVRAARKTILGNHEYQTQHEAAGLRRIPTAEIEAFNDELNSFDYGILVDGRILTGNNIDFFKYRTISPEQVRRYKAGVCWDYVSYEYEWFKRHYPKQMRFTKDSFNLNTSQYSCYYMEHIDEDQDHPTHTWLAYTYDGKVYAFESAWKPIKGIHEFDSESTMVQWYLQQQQDYYKRNGNRLYGYVVIKYEPPSTYCMDADEFMEYVHKDGKVVYTKDFPPYK